MLELYIGFHQPQEIGLANKQPGRALGVLPSSAIASSIMVGPV
jgi:hypothetical protein